MQLVEAGKVDLDKPANDYLPQQLRTWTAWVATQRLARIASEPSPELRARLHTFSAEFSRACDRLQALCELLLPTVPHAHLRAVHFTAEWINAS